MADRRRSSGSVARPKGSASGSPTPARIPVHGSSTCRGADIRSSRASCSTSPIPARGHGCRALPAGARRLRGERAIFIQNAYFPGAAGFVGEVDPSCSPRKRSGSRRTAGAGGRLRACRAARVRVRARAPVVGCGAGPVRGSRRLRRGEGGHRAVRPGAAPRAHTTGPRAVGRRRPPRVRRQPIAPCRGRARLLDVPGRRGDPSRARGGRGRQPRASRRVGSGRRCRRHRARPCSSSARCLQGATRTPDTEGNMPLPTSTLTSSTSSSSCEHWSKAMAPTCAS